MLQSLKLAIPTMILRNKHVKSKVEVENLEFVKLPAFDSFCFIVTGVFK